ncbi:MAG: glutamate mutase L [Anaerolineaceae bacterium]|jgi:hypothetical protein
MSNSIVDAESVLAIDVGNIHTRAMLVDVVEGEYRFIASGEAPSTANAPFKDIGEGVHRAIQNLQEIVGRNLFDAGNHLIIPSQANGTGVDRMLVSYSVGAELRIAVAGLLADVSLESARHLANTTYCRIVEMTGLNDRRRSEALLDAILQAQPDLMILAGGTENGASRSVFKMAEIIIMLCRLLPQEKRPEVLYAGNQALGKRIVDALEKWTPTHLAPNVRPSIDVEDLSAAQDVLANVVTKIRQQQIGGLDGLAQQVSSSPIPTANAFGRMITFLSKIYDPAKGVLGLDVGANATIIAASVAGKLSLNVLPFGQGSGVTQFMQPDQQAEIAKWLPIQIAPEVLYDYLAQKVTFPGSVPMNAETLAIEQAIARQVIRRAFQQTLARYPNLGTSFEPIMASGAVLNLAPTPSQSLLMLLDGIQPTGVTTLVLDQNGILPGLGAIARINQILPVQVLESGAFLNLGTVISPVSDARYGTPILRVRLEYEGGNDTRMDIRQGSINVLPLQNGQVARIHFQALRNVEITPGHPHDLESFKIVGGACGAIIDARGRPVALPADASRRREMLKKWSLILTS